MQFLFRSLGLVQNIWKMKLQQFFYMKQKLFLGLLFFGINRKYYTLKTSIKFSLEKVPYYFVIIEQEADEQINTLDFSF